MRPTLKTIAGQPSWVIRNGTVELAVTRLGGQMAPVTFYRDSGHPIQPYHLTPWQGKDLRISEPVLRPLRGDFFCLPFGGGSYRGRDFCCHGESASAPWSLAEATRQGGRTVLRLRMNCSEPAGRITKTLALVDGQNVVYSQDLLDGFSGRWPMGHHATLAMPGEQESASLSTSPFALGLTWPQSPGDPGGGYWSLEVGRTFKDLARVPTIWKSPAWGDCTRYPRAKGFCDVLGVFARPRGRTPAWTAVTFGPQGYLWFSLKDAGVLPCLTIWSENYGRHDFPWNGQNSCVGFEDGVAFLATGVGPSLAPNAVSQAGIPTAMALSLRKPTAINYIQGVLKVPRGFTRVTRAVFGPGQVTFVGNNGTKATAKVSHDFVFTGSI